MILSTHESSRVRNLAMSALHSIAADQLCEVSDIIALITPSQPEPSSSRPTAADTPDAPAGDTTDGEVPPASPSVEPITEAPKPLPEARGKLCAAPAFNPPPAEAKTLEQGALSSEPGEVQDRCVSTSPTPSRLRKETARAKILATHAEYPDWPSKLIAQHLGISEDAVRATASRKKLKLVSWWDYERALKAQTTEALKASPAKPPEAAELPSAPQVEPPPEQPPAPAAEPPLPPVEADSTDVLHRPRKAPTGRFYLIDRGSPMATPRYVHQSLQPSSNGHGPMMTTDRKWAWFDNMERYRGAKKKWPQIAFMRKEAAHA